MKRLLGTLVLLLFPVLLRAQCTGSSPTWTSTADETSVSQCITKASAGDTVHVTGSGSVTWANSLLITKPLKIIGPGASNLTILDNAGSTNALFRWTGTFGTEGCAATTTVCFRLSGFTISPLTSNTAANGPINVAGTCTSTSCPNVRIDNNSITGWSESGNGLYASWLILADNVFGVVDHNFLSCSSCLAANVNHSAYLGVGTYGDNSWASADSFGGPNALYFENNTYDSNNTSSNDCDAAPYGGTVGGCRVTVRFNTFNNPGGAAVTNHGTESTGRNRGGRQLEVYANTMTCLNTSFGCVPLGYRGGAAILWGDSFSTSAGSWMNSAVSFSNYRTYNSYPPWGTCDGTSPYDTNDGTVYDSGTYTGTTGSQNFVDSSKNWMTNRWVSPGSPYSIHNVTHNWGEQIQSNTATTITPYFQACSNIGPACTWTNGDQYQILRATVCVDQPGRGAGILHSGNSIICNGFSNAASPCSPANEARTPIYEWADSFGGNGYNMGVVSGIGSQIIANRDYYEESKNQSAQNSPTSPFNGSSGAGHGTKVHRPTTCTTGVAYWAEDEGDWNTTNTTIPGTPGYTQGNLYICTATNTWTLHYTPYTYPHPLVTGSTSGTGGIPPNPPTGLTAIVQ